MKANDQDKDLIIQQKQAMDKVSKKELSLLVQKSKSRSMNVCNAQTDNLTRVKISCHPLKPEPESELSFYT